MKYTALTILLVSCIYAPERPVRDEHLVGAAPAPISDPAKWTSCESARHKHNAFVLLGVGFGILGGTSTLAEDTNDNGRKLAIKGAGVGSAATGAIFAVLAGFAADDYSMLKCSDVTPP